MPIKYREMDEILLQVQVDFAKFLQNYEIYMLGSRNPGILGENNEFLGGRDDNGDLYGQEKRQFVQNSPEFGPPAGFPAGGQPEYP